jgi:hypothetical protein
MSSLTRPPSAHDPARAHHHASPARAPHYASPAAGSSGLHSWTLPGIGATRQRGRPVTHHVPALLPYRSTRPLQAPQDTRASPGAAAVSRASPMEPRHQLSVRPMALLASSRPSEALPYTSVFYTPIHLSRPRRRCPYRLHARTQAAECTCAGRRVHVRRPPSARTQAAECTYAGRRVHVRRPPSARAQAAECLCARAQRRRGPSVRARGAPACRTRVMRAAAHRVHAAAAPATRRQQRVHAT